MRLGTAPITWGVCEMDGWGDRLPFERVLDEMAGLGFAGTELGPPGYLPPDSLASDLSRRGLALVGAFCPVSLHRTESIAESTAQALETAGLLRDAGAELLVLADAGSSERLDLAGRVANGANGLTGDEWMRFADGIQEIAVRASHMGVRSVFHPEAGSYVETVEEIQRLLALTDGQLLGLCLDTGHVTYGGGNAAELARRYANRIGHVHAKDVDPSVLARVRDHGLNYFDAAGAGIFARVGSGCVDFVGVLDALRAADYDGWLIVEQDVRINAQSAIAALTANAAASKSVLEQLLTRL